MKSDNSGVAHANHQLMSSGGRLDSAKSTSGSVKAEPLEQMALYSSHFAKTPSALSNHQHVDTASSMLTGLPHLTPAPYTMHQGFTLDDMKYHHHHHPAAASAAAAAAHTHPQPDYSSFAASAAAASAASMTTFPSYPGLSSAPEHSNVHHHHHHHHAKLNLQTT